MKLDIQFARFRCLHPVYACMMTRISLIFLICYVLICSTFLVYIMGEGHFTKRGRRTIGILFDACGKQFATSHAFDKHRTSGYLRGTACHVLDDGSTRTQLVATSRPTMSTATLHKLKISGRSHGTTILNLCCISYLCDLKLLRGSNPRL